MLFTNTTSWHDFLDTARVVWAGVVNTARPMNTGPSASSGILRVHRQTALIGRERPATKTITHTVGVVVGVTYMLMWTNHRSVGVVTWLLSTNEGRMTVSS